MTLPGGIGADPRRLGDIGLKELGVRFLFGCAISLVAGVISMRYGPRVGGLFLAFPAILPASLTLIEDKRGNHQAMVDAMGAILGGVALGAFAALASLLLRHFPAGLALAFATAAWLLVAVGLYLVAAAVLRSHGRNPAAPDQPGSARRRTTTA